MPVTHRGFIPSPVRMLLCCPPLGLRGKQPARRSAPIPGGLHGDPKATYGVTRHRQAPTLPAGSPPCPAEERALHTAPSAPAWVAASPTTAPPPPRSTPRGRAGGPTGSAAPAELSSRTAAFAPVPNGGTKPAGGNTCWNPRRAHRRTGPTQRDPLRPSSSMGARGPPSRRHARPSAGCGRPGGPSLNAQSAGTSPLCLHCTRGGGGGRHGEDPPPPPRFLQQQDASPASPSQIRGTVALSPAVTPLGHRAGTGATFPAPPARPRCNGAGWPWVHWEGQTWGGTNEEGTGLTPCHAFGVTRGCRTTPAGAMPPDPKKVGAATE